jgi:hypothetical protein
MRLRVASTAARAGAIEGYEAARWLYGKKS